LTGQKDLSNFDLEREQASSSTTGFVELIDSLDSSACSPAWIHRPARQLDSSTYSTAGFVDLFDSWIRRLARQPGFNWPARQLVGKTRWVFRQPNGRATAWFYTDGFPYWMVSLDWTHAADGRPSGSSLQAGEEEMDWIKCKSET
jgi:hypothetical protein